MDRSLESRFLRESSPDGEGARRSLPVKCESQRFTLDSSARRPPRWAGQVAAAAASTAKWREPPASASGSSSSPRLTKPRLGRKLPLGKIAAAATLPSLRVTEASRNMSTKARSVWRKRLRISLLAAWHGGFGNERKLAGRSSGFW